MPEAVALLGLDEPLVGSRTRTSSVCTPVRPVVGCGGTSVLAPPAGAHLIPRDREEPRCEALLGIVRARAPDDPKPDFLEDVVGIGHAGGGTPQEGDERAFMTADEGGRVFGVAGRDVSHQQLIGHVEIVAHLESTTTATMRRFTADRPWVRARTYGAPQRLPAVP